MFSLLCVDGLMILLHFTLVRSELDHVTVVWNSVTTSDASKIQ
jgi:hypothetical protein